jgi:hypothetical protein
MSSAKPPDYDWIAHFRRRRVESHNRSLARFQEAAAAGVFKDCPPDVIELFRVEPLTPEQEETI